MRSTVRKAHWDAAYWIFIAFLAIWLVLAWHPVDRRDWAAENALVVATVVVLIWTYRMFRFSTFSYVLIALFLMLHSIGGHYTYSQVPFGFWLKHTLGLHRNPYDRIVHFAFGLLLFFPIWELVLRSMKTNRAWAYVITPALLLGTSALYEILEMWLALAAGSTGDLFLGTQGDPWDGEHDMASVLLGLTLAALIKVTKNKS